METEIDKSKKRKAEEESSQAHSQSSSLSKGAMWKSSEQKTGPKAEQLNRPQKRHKTR